MLKKRIIPVLLLKDGRMVKTQQFNKMKDTGNPITAAKIYDAQRADELVFLDIQASLEGRNSLRDIINRVTEECFMPLGVGGGVKSLEDIQELLRVGADKVIINSAAVENPDLIKQAAEKFGKANIVISIDYKLNQEGIREVYTHRGTKPTGLDPVEWAKKVSELGAGELIITSIDHEGMMGGYDLETIRLISDAVSVPVIANGGVGTLQHMKEGITVGNASGIAAASIFHFTDQSPIKARHYLKTEGVNVRL